MSDYNQNVANNPTKFHVWHDGDPSVGIWGDSATVELHVYDAEHESTIRSVLTQAFTELWDFRAHIVTEAELQAEAEAEAANERAEAEYEARRESGWSVVGEVNTIIFGGD